MSDVIFSIFQLAIGLKLIYWGVSHKLDKADKKLSKKSRVVYILFGIFFSVLAIRQLIRGLS